MRRPSVEDGASRAAPFASTDGLADTCPGVAAVFASPFYEGTNDKRLPGTFFVYLSQGKWCGLLKDPTSGTRLRIQTDTFEALLFGLESLLDSPKAPWEPDPAGPARATGGNKKRG